MNSLTIKVKTGNYKTICEALDRLEEEFGVAANVTVKCDQFESHIDTDWDTDQWLQLAWSKPEAELTNIEVYGCTQEDLRYAEPEEQVDVIESYNSSLDEEPEISEVDQDERMANDFAKMMSFLKTLR